MIEEADERRRITRLYRRYVAFTLYQCNSGWLRRDGKFHQQVTARVLECILQEFRMQRPADTMAEKAIVRRYAFLIAIEIQRRHYRRVGEVE